MDSTMTSKSSNVDESKVDDQEIVQDISLADEEDEVGETLKSQLEQRREKSRRILEQQEKDDSKQHPSRKSSHLTQDSAGLGSSEADQSDLTLSGRITPSAILPSSPRSESRSSTPFERLSGDTKAKLKSQIQARSMAMRTSGADETRFERPRRLRDRVARSARFLALTRDRDDDSALIRQVESTLKWKRAAELTRLQSGEPSEQDCYDFFTKQYEDEPSEDKMVTEHETPDEPPALEESVVSPSSPPEKLAQPQEGQDEREMIQEVEQEIDHAEEDEDKKLLSEVVAKDLDWHLFNITAAEYCGHSLQVETEKLGYFVPSRIPPSFTNKIENTAPRFLEDEGIFVGEKPEVLPTNINILENRILHQPDKGQDWFGLDGQVNCLPNPLKQFQSRPWVESEYEIDENIQTYYAKAYVPNTEEKYLEGSGENELQINIGTVSFLHHPLMSREHVLASNITQLYDEYIEKKQNNYVTFFVDKLAALRNAVADLQDHSFPCSNMDDSNTHDAHILDYVYEIGRTTRQLNKAEATERDLMRRIIEEWNHIKHLREEQGYINTTVKLTIKREEVNKEQDKAKWHEEVRMELNERKEEFNSTVIRNYKKNMEKYREQLNKWKQNRMKIKEQRKRNASKRENLLENDEVDDSEINIAGNIDKPQKPDKPETFDAGAVRVSIMNELIECRRNPGEDKLSLLLTNTTSPTPVHGVPAEEGARRKAVQKTSILLKVCFNGKQVFLTDPRPLSTDFKLHFGLIFRIRIVQWPESLKVQFLDDGLVSKMVFSEVFLQVPNTSVHSGNVQLGLTKFYSDQVVAGVHTGVGSNTPFLLRSEDLSPTSCNTHGQLICSVSWGLNEMGEVLGPKRAVSANPYAVGEDFVPPDPVRDLGAEGIQNPQSVTKWVQDTRLDPNDPENAALIPFIEDTDGHNVFHALDYFRLEHLQEEFNFLTDDEFKQLNRLRLLRLRHEEVTEFRNLTMIPCQEHEVLDSAFTPYERRMKEKTAVMVEGDKFIASGTLSSHRLEVLQFRERVQDEVLNRFYAARHYRTFEDVVHEEQVPDVKTLGLALGKAVEPRRPLKPVRKERKKAVGQALTEGSVNILVTAVRAHNLPVRRPGPPQAAAQGTMTSTFRGNTLPAPAMTRFEKFYNLSSFVAVSFQDNVVTSRVGAGPTPSWNEELKVPFSAPNNDYSSNSLQTVDDNLFIHLFDRVVEDLPQKEEEPSVVSQKVSNHWLGSFKLPFSTLYHRGHIDGTFKLKVPPVLLGYDLGTSPPQDIREEFEAQFTRYSDGSYITLYITLDPILRPVEAVKGRFESKEEEEILSKCATFLAECHRKYPQRHVKTTVIDLKGESVLITRYVSPLQPPAELSESSEFASLAACERLARFVSLIPFASDNVTFAGVCDLWSTCDQFIHMLKGDEEEHAVLLLNYFLHLGKEAYLVLGNAIPEGNTAYVLTVESATAEYYIWNASTGEYCSSKDSLCPLKSIGTLINDKNIWFNVQPHDLPSKLRYNLNKTSDWKPLFSSVPTSNLATIQPASLYYVITDRSYVAKLTNSITEKLKNKIMSWRPRHVTRWNRACSAILYDILKGLEGKYLRRGESYQELDHTAKLSDKMGEYTITGFPMDMPFVDIDSIVTTVRSTEVHKIQDPAVEFSVAVYIHPYPASVMAVWVYVAALINRNRWDI